MKTYTIVEVSTVFTTYEVEAKDEDDAVDKLYDGEAREVESERSEVYIENITEGRHIMTQEEMALDSSKPDSKYHQCTDCGDYSDSTGIKCDNCKD